jgi:hypothetical protein
MSGSKRIMGQSAPMPGARPLFLDQPIAPPYTIPSVIGSDECTTGDDWLTV